jgi:Fe-S-cluster containining protein
MGGKREEAIDALIDLHREIDEAAVTLARRHAERLRCARGCAACCLDDLTVRPIEAERIRRHHADLLRDGVPHPPGACAFLDSQGACRIYDDRPSVCRSQGLPLRVLFEDEAGEIAEHRDICPLNQEGGPALERLEEEDLWLVGPYELRLASLDADFLGEESGVEDEVRIALRSLFASSCQAGATSDTSLPTTPR